MFPFPLKSQELPSLEKVEPYAKQRLQLLQAGWQKVIVIKKDCDWTEKGTPRNSFSRLTCFKYEEHDNCFPDKFCDFKWRDARGKTLTIVTFDDTYKVINWFLE